MAVLTILLLTKYIMEDIAKYIANFVLEKYFKELI